MGPNIRRELWAIAAPADAAAAGVPAVVGVAVDPPAAVFAALEIPSAASPLLVAPDSLAGVDLFFGGFAGGFAAGPAQMPLFYKGQQFAKTSDIYAFAVSAAVITAAAGENSGAAATAGRWHEALSFLRGANCCTGK